MSDTMDIYSPRGTKVYFLGKNGYETELNLALKQFVIGEELTVDSVEVGSSVSYVKFMEHKRSWNTVMFGPIGNKRLMENIQKVDGWKTSDGKIWKSEAEAIDNEQYLNTKKAIADLVRQELHGDYSGAINAAAYILATHRRKLYDILKDNV